MAQLLVAANADVNAKNNKGATPLIIAAVKGHHSVLRLLANHSSINLHEQVSLTHWGRENTLYHFISIGF